MNITEFNEHKNSIPKKLSLINPDYNFIEYDFFSEYEEETKSMIERIVKERNLKGIIVRVEDTSDIDYIVKICKGLVGQNNVVQIDVITGKRIIGKQPSRLVSKDDFYKVILIPSTIKSTM